MTLSLKCALAATVIVGIVVGSSASAAQPGAALAGRVVDTVGAPISDVTITLHNLDNGQVVHLQSDQDGRYFRHALTIGRYELTLEKEGYVTVRDQSRLGTGRTKHDSVMTPAVVARIDPGSSLEYAAAFEAFNAGALVRAIEILAPLVEVERDFAAGFLLLARSYFELEQWEDAVVGYRRVIELQPDMANAYLDIGVAYMETGDLQSASSSFAKALALQPDDASVHYNIGTIYIQADRVDDAIDYLTKATELDPESALSHKALAFALARRSDMEGAIRHLERYLEIAPDAPDAEEMANLLEQLRGS
jgi:tetratricopeptide (TPR) repeat protein